MALQIIGTCKTCGAQQLSNNMILVNPGTEQQCTTHDFQPTEEQEAFPEPQMPPKRMPTMGGGGSASQLPTREECQANDELNDHQVKVDNKIRQTQGTIETLDQRHNHWRQVITEDFQRVMDAAAASRDRLLNDLDDLVRGKQDQLSSQLHDYQDHFNDCQNMLDTIFRRIQLDPRDGDRQHGIVQDSRDTIRAFPVLIPVPIAVVAECQTQPVVDVLQNFGSILEDDLGRLPTVFIEEVSERDSSVKYSVLESEDAEEKQAVNFIPRLQVEFQATVYAERSLGWEVLWKNRIPCDKTKGTMRIDCRSLPRTEEISVRARTIIVDGAEGDPVRISKWSDVVKMRNQIVPGPRPGPDTHRRQPVRAMSPDASNGGGNELPTKQIFVVCVDPETGAKLPCRPAPPDYVAGIRNAAIRKWSWSCSPEDIELKIVRKVGLDLVTDLSQEAHPNHVLAEVWDRNTHFVHLVKAAGEVQPGTVPVGSVGSVGLVEEAEDPDIVWPKRLMVRIKQDPAKESPARPSPLKIEDRERPGGWLAALQKRYCERFSIPEEGQMQFYFVDDEGERVKDVLRDSDLLYVQENRKVYAVGEMV